MIEAQKTYGETGVLYPPAQLSDTYAMRVYGSPGDVCQTLKDLKTDLRAYARSRSAGLSEDPDKIQHRTNRTLYKAVGAPLYFLAELAASKHFLSAWHGSLNLERYGAGLPQSSAPSYPFEGAYEEYRGIEAAVNLYAARKVAAQVQQPGHPYHPVWQAYTDIYPAFAATDFAARGWQRPENPADDFAATMERLPEDTMLPFMMKVVLQMKQGQGMAGNASFKWLMRHYEEFAWASTLSRHTRAQVFPDPGVEAGTSPRCPFAAGEKNVVTLATPAHWVCGNPPAFWDRPEIHDGPRESSSFCPLSSNVEFYSTDPDAVDIVEDMYAIPEFFGAVRRLTRVRGTGVGAEMHSIRSSALLGKTVLGALQD